LPSEGVLSDPSMTKIVAHLSTTRGQVEAGLREWGKTPLARYRDLGVLGPNSAPPEHETTVNSI
jgi:hypothetical protein